MPVLRGGAHRSALVSGQFSPGGRLRWMFSTLPCTSDYSLSFSQNHYFGWKKYRRRRRRLGSVKTANFGTSMPSRTWAFAREFTWHLPTPAKEPYTLLPRVFMSAMNGVRTNPKLKPPPVRLYKYRMAGIPKPIIIAAATREKARELLCKLIAKSPTLQKSEVLDETVERPISGVTTIRQAGHEYVWHAERDGTQGWKLRLTNG